MSNWTIYWLTRLDVINAICTVSGVLLGIGSLSLIIFCIISASNSYDKDEYKMCLRIRKWVFPLTFICIAIAVFVPSSKEFAAIYLIPKIVNNEQVQQIPDKGLSLLNSKLDQWLDDIRKEKEKK